MLPRRRTNWFRLGWLLGLLMVAGWVFSLVGVYVWGHRDTARPAAIIVVLGAAQYAGRPSPVLRARIDHAIDLWRRGLGAADHLHRRLGDRDTTSEAAVAAAIRHRPWGHSARDHDREQRSLDGGIAPAGCGAHGGGAVAHRDSRERSVSHAASDDPGASLRNDAYTSPTRTSPISLSWRESWKYVLAESIKVPIVFLLERRE